MNVLEYKVHADIGDDEGGSYYHIASFNSVAMALIFISGLKPMFGYNTYIMVHILGIDMKDKDIIFKGVKLMRGSKEILEEFY